MKKRPLGFTGMEVSALGFGSWPLSDAGWGQLCTDEEAIFLIRSAHDLGCNLFDAAPQFGRGRAEDLLGRALDGERNTALLSTKFCCDPQGRQRPDGEVEASLDESLRRLRTDHVDLYLCDCPNQEDLEAHSGLFAGMEKLRQKGKVRAWGVSVDEAPRVALALEKKLGSVIELRFNVLAQEPAEHFAWAAQLGVGLVARTPLDSGWLSGNYDSHTRFRGLRARWTSETIRRRLELVEDLGFLAKPGTSLAQASLQFVLAHPEISCAIPGSRDMQQLEYNVSAASKTLEADKVEKARDLHFRKIKGNPLPW